MKKTVAFCTLGCKVNQYETDAMRGSFEAEGYEVKEFSQEASVYVINTCTVTNMEDRKSRQMMHRAKKKNPDGIIVAVGCYVQAAKEQLEEDTLIDLVIGNNMKSQVVQIVEQYIQDNRHTEDRDAYVADIAHSHEYETMHIETVSEHTRAYIKIQDGCNQFCSYCIIPYTRGRIRSRAIEDVVDEVRRLADNGYKEVVLTGIHLSSYGRDTGKETLLDVIEAVNSIDGIERIRLGSLEPRIVTDEFVSRISSMKKLCPHFHLSLQSGCDKTLKAMNRKYDTAEYLKGCEILRKYYDNPAITTDVIVGFPGETEEDFKITKAFVEKVHFYEMHIFKYSRRKGTVADTMPDQVDDKIKTARSNELIELANEMSAQYRSTYADSDLSVLIEEKQNIAGKEYYTGYTPNYIRVMISAEEFDKENVCSNSGNGNIINNIYTVKGCGLDKEKLHIIGMENYNG